MILFPPNTAGVQIVFNDEQELLEHIIRLSELLQKAQRGNYGASVTLIGATEREPKPSSGATHNPSTARFFMAQPEKK